jgi:hypothetical protein
VYFLFYAINFVLFPQHQLLQLQQHLQLLPNGQSPVNGIFLSCVDGSIHHDEIFAIFAVLSSPE